MTKWEYATIDWSWDDEAFRIDRPDGEVEERSGSYDACVELLNDMGAEGWELAGKVAVGDWIYYTFKRPQD